MAEEGLVRELAELAAELEGVAAGLRETAAAVAAARARSVEATDGVAARGAHAPGRRQEVLA